MSSCFSPFLKNSFANSHLSGTTFLNPCIATTSLLTRIKTHERTELQKVAAWRFAYVGVELADERREVVVLEVVGEDVARELRRPPHDEGGHPVVPPRDDVVSGRVIHQLIRLGQERRRHRLLRRRRRRLAVRPAPAPLHLPRRSTSSLPLHYSTTVSTGETRSRPSRQGFSGFTSGRGGVSESVSYFNREESVAGWVVNTVESGAWCVGCGLVRWMCPPRGACGRWGWWEGICVALSVWVFWREGLEVLRFNFQGRPVTLAPACSVASANKKPSDASSDPPAQQHPLFSPLLYLHCPVVFWTFSAIFCGLF